MIPSNASSIKEAATQGLHMCRYRERPGPRPGPGPWAGEGERALGVLGLGLA